MTPGIQSVSDNPYRAVMQAAQSDAPYLARLVEKRKDLTEILRLHGPDAVLKKCLSELSEPNTQTSLEQTGEKLRQSKDALHLACAAADLAGVWPLQKITSALSGFADLAINKALSVAWMNSCHRGEPSTPLEKGGHFILGMGKLGAHELNYSSDIDLIVFFDPKTGETGKSVADTKEMAIHIVRKCLKMLHEVTEDGYVFRVDLRLRPDPGSTAIAVSTKYALDYYESVGQNWERMAFVKARFCAGDQMAANSFLKQLHPFIWRKHLDYWAIEDIRAISAQIHAGAEHHDLGDPVFDVKLGRGGIREIEFLAQTRQLILGGREVCLRMRETCRALEMLGKLNILSPENVQTLIEAYQFLRALEHRIQMRQDEQTHFLPGDTDTRSAVIRLCGSSDVAAFDSWLAELRQRVHSAYANLFEPQESLSGRSGNLVFTGVDDDPGTVQTLSEMGFSNPPKLIATIRDWYRGGKMAATRSARGRGLLTRLVPRLLEAVSETGSPDIAWQRLVDFLTGLKAGVQVFSLMLAEPELTGDLIATMAYAPQLSRDMARRPDMLEAMLGVHFHTPLRKDTPGRRLAILNELVAPSDFEAVCDAVRLFKREESLRIGYQLLKRRANAREVGLAYADLAESCIQALAHRVVQELEARHGRWTARWAVCGLGRLGAAEMTATSDLDLILIHETGSNEDDRMSTRFTQRLISALSAPTAEGSLYDVDMRLRPSGRAGPIAVKLSAFESYYQTQAWTWEYMALARLRPLAGDPELHRKITEKTCSVLAQARQRRKNLRADIHDMRLRLEQERPAVSEWDLKLTPGGLFDAEFLIQKEILERVCETSHTLHTGTLEAMEALPGAFSDEETQILREGILLQQELGQALSVANADVFDPEIASSGMKTWLAAICKETDFEALHHRLKHCQAAIARLRQKKIGRLATES